jgi:signal transduction histidine kinase
MSPADTPAAPAATERRWTRPRLGLLAALCAVAVAVPAPLFFAEASARGLRARAEAVGAALANQLGDVATRQPRTWRYGVAKTLGPIVAGPGGVGLARLSVVDCAGGVLAGDELLARTNVGRGPAAWRPITRSGVTLGWVRVEMDGAPTRTTTALIALLSGLGGALLGLGLWLGPLAMIDREARAREAALTALRVARSELADSHAALQSRVDEAVAKVRALGRSSLVAVEGERRRIARDLHDDLGQQLSALRLAIDVVLRAAGADDDALPLVAARDRVEDAIDSLRRVVADLRPSGLQEEGVGVTLAAACARFEVDHGVEVAFRHDGDEVADEVLAAALLRVLREALHNSRSHGAADEVSVRLRVDEDALRLEIRDEGCGFDVARLRGARRERGLGGIEERLRLLGGMLEIDSEVGVGTRLRATVARPFDPPRAHGEATTEVSRTRDVEAP